MVPWRTVGFQMALWKVKHPNERRAVILNYLFEVFMDIIPLFLGLIVFCSGLRTIPLLRDMCNSKRHSEWYNNARRNRFIALQQFGMLILDLVLLPLTITTVLFMYRCPSRFFLVLYWDLYDVQWDREKKSVTGVRRFHIYIEICFAFINYIIDIPFIILGLVVTVTLWRAPTMYYKLLGPRGYKSLWFLGWFVKCFEIICCWRFMTTLKENDVIAPSPSSGLIIYEENTENVKKGEGNTKLSNKLEKVQVKHILTDDYSVEDDDHENDKGNVKTKLQDHDEIKVQDEYREDKRHTSFAMKENEKKKFTDIMTGMVKENNKIFEIFPDSEGFPTGKYLTMFLEPHEVGKLEIASKAFWKYSRNEGNDAIWVPLCKKYYWSAPIDIPDMDMRDFFRNKIIDKLNREHKIRYMRQHNIDNRTVLATHRVQHLVETEFIYNIRKQLQGGRGVVLVEFVHTMLDLPFIILAFISIIAPWRYLQLVYDMRCGAPLPLRKHQVLRSEAANNNKNINDDKTKHKIMEQYKLDNDEEKTNSKIIPRTESEKDLEEILALKLCDRELAKDIYKYCHGNVREALKLVQKPMKVHCYTGFDRRSAAMEAFQLAICDYASFPFLCCLILTPHRKFYPLRYVFQYKLWVVPYRKANHPIPFLRTSRFAPHITVLYKFIQWLVDLPFCIMGLIPLFSWRCFLVMSDMKNPGLTQWQKRIRTASHFLWIFIDIPGFLLALLVALTGIVVGIFSCFQSFWRLDTFWGEINYGIDSGMGFNLARAAIKATMLLFVDLSTLLFLLLIFLLGGAARDFVQRANDMNRVFTVEREKREKEEVEHFHGIFGETGMDEKVVAFALKSGFKDFAGNRHMEKLNEEMNRGKPYDWSVTLELGYLGVDSEKIINDLNKGWASMYNFDGDARYFRKSLSFYRPLILELFAESFKRAPQVLLAPFKLTGFVFIPFIQYIWLRTYGINRKWPTMSMFPQGDAIEIKGTPKDTKNSDDILVTEKQDIVALRHAKTEDHTLTVAFTTYDEDKNNEDDIKLSLEKNKTVHQQENDNMYIKRSGPWMEKHEYEAMEIQEYNAASGAKNYSASAVAVAELTLVRFWREQACKYGWSLGIFMQLALWITHVLPPKINFYYMERVLVVGLLAIPLLIINEVSILILSLPSFVLWFFGGFPFSFYSCCCKSTDIEDKRKEPRRKIFKAILSWIQLFCGSPMIFIVNSILLIVPFIVFAILDGVEYEYAGWENSGLNIAGSQTFANLNASNDNNNATGTTTTANAIHGFKDDAVLKTSEKIYAYWVTVFYYIEAGDAILYGLGYTLFWLTVCISCFHLLLYRIPRLATSWDPLRPFLILITAGTGLGLHIFTIELAFVTHWCYRNKRWLGCAGEVVLPLYVIYRCGSPQIVVIYHYYFKHDDMWWLWFILTVPWTLLLLYDATYITIKGNFKKNPQYKQILKRITMNVANYDKLQQRKYFVKAREDAVERHDEFVEYFRKVNSTLNPTLESDRELVRYGALAGVSSQVLAAWVVARKNILKSNDLFELEQSFKDLRVIVARSAKHIKTKDILAHDLVSLSRTMYIKMNGWTVATRYHFGWCLKTILGAKMG